MRPYALKIILFFVLALFVIVPNLHRASGVEHAKSSASSFHVTSWPPPPFSFPIYEAKPGDENLRVDHIKIPADFTIVFPDNVTNVVWRTRLLEFGEGCTIDLRHFELWKALSMVSPEPITVKDYGQNGDKGKDGGTGEVGANGISFTLIADRIVPGGSLWIRTDGSPGKVGGWGGQGGTGGGSRCLNAVSPGEDGGRGGDGGDAGPGGRGGDTSAVKIVIDHMPSGNPISPVACQSSPPCGSSQRPASANGNNGAIIIWGGPGCGGEAGTPGRGGRGGDEGFDRPCPMFVRDRKGGARGNQGHTAKPGENGRCTVGVPPA